LLQATKKEKKERKEKKRRLLHRQRHCRIRIECIAYTLLLDNFFIISSFEGSTHASIPRSNWETPMFNYNHTIKTKIIIHLESKSSTIKQHHNAAASHTLPSSALIVTPNSFTYTMTIVSLFYLLCIIKIHL